MIPEIHDILKLCSGYKFSGAKRERSPHSNIDSVAKEAKTLGYDLTSNLTWSGVLKHHHGWNFRLYPDNPDLFLLDMADSLAAAISRGDNRLRLGHRRPYTKFGYDDRVFKLWKNNKNDIKKRRMKRPLDLKSVFDFFTKNPTLDDFFNFVGDAIYIRAEDATIGANLTSLYVHSILTGKFYRVLKSASYSVTQGDMKNRNQITKLYNEKLQGWELTVTRLKILFPQKPVRTKDMNVFDKLKEIRKRLDTDFEDNILFNTSDEILMILPPKEDISILIKPYLDYGFWVEFSEKTQCLKAIHPNPERDQGDFSEGSIYKKLLPEISPHICEICQMDKGDREWVKDFILTMEICETCKNNISKVPWPPDSDLLCEKDLADIEKWFDEDIVENLCQGCFDIRVSSEETRLNQLKKWSEEETDPMVIWVKINLDFFQLIESLEKLYGEYLDHIGVDSFQDKVEIRFSVLAEFYREYHEFLVRFENKLRERFKGDMEVPILEDFFVIRIDTLRQILDVVAEYKALFESYFLRFKEIHASPLKLSISCSSAKFPFFEHWEIIQRPKSDVHITLINKGEIKAGMKNLDEILLRTERANNKASMGALHKLATIAQMSEKLAEITLRDKSDKDYKIYREILPMGLDFSDLLTLVKIMGDEHDISKISAYSQ